MEVMWDGSTAVFNEIVLPTINNMQPLLKEYSSQLHLAGKPAPCLLMPDLAIKMLTSLDCMLDYCNTHYMGLPLMTIQKLQLVQNAAWAKYVSLYLSWQQRHSSQPKVSTPSVQDKLGNSLGANIFNSSESL